jgi:hypothetical protein
VVPALCGTLTKGIFSMADTVEGLKARLEQSQLLLELDIVGLKRGFVTSVQQFIAFDAEFNGKSLELYEQIIKIIKETPNSAFRADAGNITEIVEALQAARQGGKGSPDIRGGDIIGADWIDDMGRIIEALTSVVREEKEFFLQLIKWLLCGC